MADVTAQVTLKMKSGVTADYVSNTFHLIGIEEGTDDTAVATAIEELYDDLAPGLSSVVSQTGHILKLYVTGAPAPNYPYAEIEFAMATDPTGATLPQEVACCISYEAKRESGLNQKRRRGRIYIGPLDVAAGDLGRPTAGLIDLLLDSAETFALAIQAIDTLGVGFWGVYSPTNGSTQAIKTISVDNTYDTQRRRGLGSTNRTSRTLTLPS